MLILARKPGESLILSLSDNIDPDTPIGEVLTNPITITIIDRDCNQIKIGIDAPLAINVVRDELLRDIE